MHIKLNRKFLPVSNKDDADPDAIRFNYLWSREPQPGWQELLQMPRVIVLAEAGTGKTEEFRESARRLRREGKAAFFCAIEELVSEQVGSGLQSCKPENSYRFMPLQSCLRNRFLINRH